MSRITTTPFRRLVLAASLVGAPSWAGCAADRVDQRLPAIEPHGGPRYTIQVEPSEAFGEERIVAGLFVGEAGRADPIECFRAVVETALEESGAFEVLRPRPEESSTDARYRLVFSVADMTNEQTGAGEAMKLLELERNEYMNTALDFRLLNNATGEPIGPDEQVADRYRIRYTESRILPNLGVRSHFEKTDREKWVYVNGTIRAVVRLVEEAQERVRSYEHENVHGRADRG